MASCLSGSRWYFGVGHYSSVSGPWPAWNACHLCITLQHLKKAKHWTVISSVPELNWLCAAGTCVFVIVTSVWRYTEFVHYSLFHLASVLNVTY